MGSPAHRPVEVFRVHQAAFWITVFGALLVQAFLPLRVPLARLFDLPLLATIYFSLVRQNKVFGIALGTCTGLLQDALSHGYVGLYGMAKALAGYLAASASIRFDVEHPVARCVVTGGLVLAHNLSRIGLEQGLLESPPPFQPLELASSVLVNIALALILFQLLDRYKKPM